MAVIFNFLNFGERKKRRRKKCNIEVSKIENFGNLKREVSKSSIRKPKNTFHRSHSFKFSERYFRTQQNTYYLHQEY